MDEDGRSPGAGPHSSDEWPSPFTRSRIAHACRMLVVANVLDGVLGHVSLRLDESHLAIRCRGPNERGLRFSVSEDVHAVGFDGSPVVASDHRAPHELPIHTAILAEHDDVQSVVHAHPQFALLAGLAGIELTPLFGAYNIPAARLADAGIPVYERSVLINDRELAGEMVDAMGHARVCLLRGHGIVAVGGSLEEAVVNAVNLETLCRVAVELSRLGVSPQAIDDTDLRQLPDLGTGFNDGHTFRHLSARLATSERVLGEQPVGE
jgi:ribulose-5-phosphate 4-epimerase/fuculose-1-phosphate aldolase